MKKIIFTSYFGGKFYLVDKLLPLFPHHISYVEPFCGSCVLLLNKRKSRCETVNDYNKDIWNLFNVVKNKPEEFSRHFNFMVKSRFQFQLYNQQDPDKLNDVERAVRYYYLLRFSFGSKMLNPSFATHRDSKHNGIDFSNIHDLIYKVYDRIKSVCIENLDYAECIRRYDKDTTFFFIDPPYLNEGIKKKKSRYYVYDFNESKFKQLNEVLKSIRGKFLMTVQNEDFTRNLFKDFQQTVMNHIYCIRAKSISDNINSTRTTQLLVHNYPLKPKRYKLK